MKVYYTYKRHNFYRLGHINLNMNNKEIKHLFKLDEPIDMINYDKRVEKRIELMRLQQHITHSIIQDSIFHNLQIDLPDLYINHYVIVYENHNSIFVTSSKVDYIFKKLKKYLWDNNINYDEL